jgi:poly-gamma-glutamate synthase PgsB/CapB
MAAGAVEWLIARRARAAIPLRIHVNGTRGKSTVTRLIHAALLEAAIPALGKTTGTAARWLLPDGTEQSVKRRGRPNIREQMKLLRKARRLEVRAIVVECMAVHPALQWTSEKEMVMATVGVITNVRTDHTEAMGRSLEEIALSLANTTPRRGTLVLGEPSLAPFFRRIAEPLGTRIVEVPDQSSHATGAFTPDAAPATVGGSPRRFEPGWMRQSCSIALAVTRHLGITDSIALRGMLKALPDPGASRIGRIRLGNRLAAVLDVRAANDPESFRLLLQDYSSHFYSSHPEPKAKDLSDQRDPSFRFASVRRTSFFRGFTLPTLNPEGGRRPQPDSPRFPPGLVLVYNHRADRPERLHCFMKDAAFTRAAAGLVVTGDRPCWTLWHALCRAVAGVTYIRADRLLQHLEQMEPGLEEVVFCGNARGLDLRQVVFEEAAHG